MASDLQKAAISMVVGVLLLLAPFAVRAQTVTTYRCQSANSCLGPAHVVFNRYSNYPIYGNERYFYDAKDDANAGRGGFSNSLYVQDGEVVAMRIFVHNDADAINHNISTSDATGRNVQVSATLPVAPVTSYDSRAGITAANANPGAVSDTLNLRSSYPFTAEYIDGSMAYGTVAMGQQPLNVFPTNSGNQVVLRTNLGDIPPTGSNSGFVIFKVRISQAFTGGALAPPIGSYYSNGGTPYGAGDDLYGTGGALAPNGGVYVPEGAAAINSLNDLYQPNGQGQTQTQTSTIDSNGRVTTTVTQSRTGNGNGAVIYSQPQYGTGNYPPPPQYGTTNYYQPSTGTNTYYQPRAGVTYNQPQTGTNYYRPQTGTYYPPQTSTDIYGQPVNTTVTTQPTATTTLPASTTTTNYGAAPTTTTTVPATTTTPPTTTTVPSAATAPGATPYYSTLPATGGPIPAGAAALGTLAIAYALLLYRRSRLRLNQALMSL
jgi:hypothetical protein